jgi:hypothetical protein
MEGLLGYLEKLKVIILKINKPLREVFNNTWVKLRKYYNLIDNSYEIYIAISLFYLYLRLVYFKEY